MPVFTPNITNYYVGMNVFPLYTLNVCKAKWQARGINIRLTIDIDANVSSI